MNHCPIAIVVKNVASVQIFLNFQFILHTVAIEDLCESSETKNFLSWCVARCRRQFMTHTSDQQRMNTESILSRDEEVSHSWGNTKIGPVLEVATCCLHGTCGVEIRIMSLNNDNSHSWVRSSHESNKFVMNLNNEQEVPEVQLEEFALKLDAKDFASQSKDKAKPTKKRICRLFHKNNTYWD